MKKNFVDESRGRMIIFLGVLLAALWMVIAHETYMDSKEEKYNGRVRPGVVSSGTRSATPAPMVSMPTYHGHTPMISGAEVRSYAYSGHATMPSAASGSGLTVRTTSSATLHSIGAGGGGGGGISGGGSSSSRSGITYGGGSVSMPTLALATSSRTTYRASDAIAGMTASLSAQTAAAAPVYSAPGVRKAKPTDDGENDGDQVVDTDGVTVWTWSEDAEDWLNTTPVGTKRYDSEKGYMVEWNGTEWVQVVNQGDPNAPIGDTPWVWMLMLLAAYGGVKALKTRKNKTT